MITEPDYITVKLAAVGRNGNHYNVVWFRWSAPEDSYTVHWISERMTLGAAFKAAHEKADTERVAYRP